MNESDDTLTLHHNVLACPEVVRAAEDFRIYKRRIFPVFPLCPVTAVIPRVTEHVRAIGLV
jgi:hypothetical protein